jgi:uncharacterized coiled-coil protein SlyX
MKHILLICLVLVYACGEYESTSKNSIRERQELEKKVASLNQVIKEMSDEIHSLQAEIDALNGRLADCEQDEWVPPEPPENESEPKSEPPEANKQQNLLDYFENRESRKK